MSPTLKVVVSRKPFSTERAETAEKYQERYWRKPYFSSALFADSVVSLMITAA
jgi:hypothetical protein